MDQPVPEWVPPSVAEWIEDPRAETWLRYAVYALVALGFSACLLVGAGRPADPSLIPAPTTTVAPAPPAAPPPGPPPAPPGSVAP